jgi:hypothetical protein
MNKTETNDSSVCCLWEAGVISQEDYCQNCVCICNVVLKPGELCNDRAIDYDWSVKPMDYRMDDEPSP